MQVLHVLVTVAGVDNAVSEMVDSSVTEYVGAGE